MDDARHGAGEGAARPEPRIAGLTLRGRIARPQPRGLRVVNLGYNELPHPPGPAVAAALRQAAERANAYGAPFCDDLRAALGAAHGLDPATLICGNGSEELLDVVGRVFAGPGDEVVISEFGYVQFALVAHRIGARLVKARERELHGDVDALLAAVTPRTRVLFLANPNNPTGTVLPVAELRRLADALPGRVVLVLDLAYGEFVSGSYCGEVHALARDRANVIVTRTFSKAYGLAGARAGWAAVPAWMLPSLYAARGMGSVNALAQAAATAALGEVDLLRARVAETVAERDRMAGALRAAGFACPPSAANFLLVAPPNATPERTEALVEHLFDAGGFVVNRTREAGLERFLRFSLGTPEQNARLLACLTDGAGA